MQGSRIDATLRAEARARRQAPGPARHGLWQGLKRLNRLAGCHFRRQAPVGPVGWTILDFADFGRRLAIEIVAEHAEMRDGAARCAWLEGRGFRVLSLPRDRVLGEPAAVLAEIAQAAGGAAGPAGCCHEDTHPAAPPASARPQNGDEP